MIPVRPVTPTVIVHRLAHVRAAAPPLFGRILQWVPRIVSPAPIVPHVPKSLPLASSRRPAFAVYAARAPIVHDQPQPKLGIRPGSWIPVVLRHGITDNDRALVVLHVTAEVHGMDGSLPKGTRLLARVASARGGRVQLSVSAAVMPDGRQLALEGVVFDAQRAPGLSGFVVGGRRQAVLVALGRSLAQSADTALGMMAAQASLTSQTLSDAGRSTLGVSRSWAIARRVVYVPAQHAYVQTQKGS